MSADFGHTVFQAWADVVGLTITGAEGTAFAITIGCAFSAAKMRPPTYHPAIARPIVMVAANPINMRFVCFWAVMARVSGFARMSSLIVSMLDIKHLLYDLIGQTP